MPRIYIYTNNPILKCTVPPANHRNADQPIRDTAAASKANGVQTINDQQKQHDLNDTRAPPATSGPPSPPPTPAFFKKFIRRNPLPPRRLRPANRRDDLYLYLAAAVVTAAV